MLDNHTTMGSLYLLIAMMLVLGSLIGRREPIGRLIKLAVAWVVIFGAGFILFTFRDNFTYVAERLKTEVTGRPMVEGGEVRIPMAVDGHFWVEGLVNGQPVHFLVDSGATITTVDQSTAADVGLTYSHRRDQMVETANGMIHEFAGRADRLAVGSIERRDLAVHVAEGKNLNVLGMNYLSTLSSWGVEGRWLVLKS